MEFSKRIFGVFSPLLGIQWNNFFIDWFQDEKEGLEDIFLLYELSDAADVIQTGDHGADFDDALIHFVEFIADWVVDIFFDEGRNNFEA